MSRATGREAQNGILIVGAGLAGLTLALALAKRGIKSTVVEKQREITPSRWPIVIGALSLNIFAELKILDEILPLGLPLRNSVVVTAEGEPIMIVDLDKWFAKTTDPRLMHLQRFNYLLLLGPSEIRSVLRRRALSHGVEILEGVEFKELLRNSGGRVVGAEVCGSTGEESFGMACKVLIGADGYKSIIRKQLRVHVERKRYVDSAAVFFANREHDLRLSKLILGDGYHVNILPCMKNRLCFVYSERGLSLDVLKQKGGERYVKEKIASTARDLSETVLSSPANLNDGSMLFLTPKAIKATPWVVDGGVLIGDAAHALHPGTGSGAQQAFYDAVALAPVLESCLKANDFSDNVLSRYEELRRPYFRFLQGWASRMFVSMQVARGRFNTWVRNRFFRKVGKLAGQPGIYQEIFFGLRPPSRIDMVRIIIRLLA